MSDKHYTTKAEANRANAAHSTGPKTEDGKRIAAHNALKTGLTGRTVLLPTDDLAHYEAHLARVDARYRPKTDDERLLAESIAHSEWRLLRIPTLETGILAVGRKQFADCHAEQPLDIRAVMIEAEVHLAFGKQLANLALQESRLHRQHERQVAKLTALLEARAKAEGELTVEAATYYQALERAGQPFPLAHLQSLGFEISLDALRRKLASEQAFRDGGRDGRRFRAEQLARTLHLTLDYNTS